MTLAPVFNKFAVNQVLNKRAFHKCIDVVAVTTEITEDFADSPLMSRYFDLINGGSALTLPMFTAELDQLLTNATYQKNMSFAVVSGNKHSKEITLQELTSYLSECWQAGCKKLGSLVALKGQGGVLPAMFDSITADNQKLIEAKAKQLYEEIKKERVSINKEAYFQWVSSNKIWALTLGYEKERVNIPLSFMGL